MKRLLYLVPFLLISCGTVSHAVLPWLGAATDADVTKLQETVAASGALLGPYGAAVTGAGAGLIGLAWHAYKAIKGSAESASKPT